VGKKDPRVDAYIDSAAPFAQPVLKHLRSMVHEACPDVEETMKWSHPAFTHKGLLAGMAAFKEHCTFGYWKGELVAGMPARVSGGMGHFGRISALADLPAKSTLIKWTRAAAALNEKGVKAEKKARPPRKALPVPAAFAAALRRNQTAKAVFDGFSPTARRDYLEWITDAKTDETRDKRIATSIDWIAEGKRRNWKYERP
jgi:uncharacterized protein YdeI (YjbR/CyaY-like superfamily)